MSFSPRAIFCTIAAQILLLGVLSSSARSANASAPINLAIYATPSTSYVSGHEMLSSINNAYNPKRADDHSHGAYGNWPKQGTQWVEYRWNKPVLTNQIAVYWWVDHQGIQLPTASRLLYFDGAKFVPVAGGGSVGVEANKFNELNFATVTTDRLRLEFDGSGTSSTGILQWKVMDAGGSPLFPPFVNLQEGCIVSLPGSLTLHAAVRGAETGIQWIKQSGPGEVTIADPASAQTTASFSVPGEYLLKLSASNGTDQSTSAQIRVTVESTPTTHLDPIFTTRYSIDSPLWSDRTKQIIIHWIPHVIEELSKPDLKEGGIQNFVEAGHRNAGKSYKSHVGAAWADAYTHNAVESMCIALQVDPKGDAEIIAAQDKMRSTLDQWIPMILAAQEPDGYLQTRFTLGLQNEYPHRPPRWTLHGEHEGYTAGYFLDAAIADYLMTEGKDRRMYDAAKKLADCWDAHIGPAPKQRWADGHEEIEQSLIRLAHLVNNVEGPGKGDRYIALAHFLLSCRGGGGEYDQNQFPVTQQYYAAGHAVRAAYLYSAMTDIAMQTGDPDYHTAVRSIWQDLVNRKYYVTGGIGSGDTSEGFGQPFSLSNNAYCESCSGCGEIFFQHKMNLAYADARYVDLLEETLYNAVLSDIDLTGDNFTYTNPLDTSEQRYKWHTCPCCVGNIPRTLLMLPTWMYATAGRDLYVNLYLGSTVDIQGGSNSLKIQQITDYPRTGHVELVITPSAQASFSLYVRVPQRGTSELYQYLPAVQGITSISVNGQPIASMIDKGYIQINRTWHAGDRVTLDLPMVVQRIHADPRVVADRGKVALRYGPLVYTFEAVDQSLDHPLPADAKLTARWDGDQLRGITTIRGQFADGSPLLAIPYYARNNRGGRSTVWVDGE